MHIARWHGFKYLGKLRGVRMFTANAKARERYFEEGMEAFVSWGAIFFRSTTAARKMAVRKHELEHIRQRRRLGPGVFEALYWIASVKYGYWDNPFEVAARRAERRTMY